MIVTTLLFIQTQMGFSDSCLEHLLRFIKLIMQLIKSTYSIESIQKLFEIFPSSIYMARQSIYLERDSFQKNVVCTVCHSLTTYEDSWTKSLTGKKITKYCKLITFPNHKQKPRRKECGNSLMKSVVTCSERNYNLYPKKVYPYRSIKSGLEELLSRTEFRGFLFEEPNRSIGQMSDIYNGCLWKEFRDPKDQQHFFTDKRHLGVMLNLDWLNLIKIKSTVLVQYI